MPISSVSVRITRVLLVESPTATVGLCFLRILEQLPSADTVKYGAGHRRYASREQPPNVCLLSLPVFSPGALVSNPADTNFEGVFRFSDWG